jgi:hypothetical protein
VLRPGRGGAGRRFRRPRMVQQAEFLENHPDPAAEGGQILAAKPGGIDPEN